MNPAVAQTGTMPSSNSLNYCGIPVVLIALPLHQKLDAVQMQSGAWIRRQRRSRTTCFDYLCTPLSSERSI